MAPEIGTKMNPGDQAPELSKSADVAAHSRSGPPYLFLLIKFYRNTHMFTPLPIVGDGFCVLRCSEFCRRVSNFYHIYSFAEMICVPRHEILSANAERVHLRRVSFKNKGSYDCAVDIRVQVHKSHFFEVLISPRSKRKKKDLKNTISKESAAILRN